MKQTVLRGGPWTAKLPGGKSANFSTKTGLGEGGRLPKHTFLPYHTSTIWAANTHYWIQQYPHAIAN